MFLPVTSLGGEGRPEYVIQIFRSVLARKVPATLACARLSDSIVRTYLLFERKAKERFAWIWDIIGRLENIVVSVSLINHISFVD